VKQGDSLSLIFFAVGFQLAVLQPLQNKLEERMGLYSQLYHTLPQIAFLLSFSDDGSVAAPRVVCEVVCQDAVKICEEAGLDLVLNKSTIVGRFIDNTYDTNQCIFPHTVGGVKIVGCPVGSEAYRDEYLREKVIKRTACLSVLTHLNSQAAYILTHKCVNARLNYLTRTMEGAFVGSAWNNFDLAIDEAVGAIAGTEATSELRVLRTLPQRRGGLGMMAYNSIPGEKGKFESRNITKAFLRRFSPYLLEATRQWDDCPSALGSLIARLTELGGGEDVTIKDAVEEQELTQLLNLQQNLIREGREGALAWLGLGLGYCTSWGRAVISRLSVIVVLVLL